MNAVIFIIQAVLIIVSLLMVLVVLMQRPKQEGLGASFGAGVTDQIWGSQTTNVLQKFTVRLAILFFALALSLCVLKAKQVRDAGGASLAAALPTEKVEKKEVPPPSPPVTNSTPIQVDPGSNTAQPITITPGAPAPAPADKPAEGTPTPAVVPAPEVPKAETPAPAAPATPAAEAPTAPAPAPATPAPETPAAPAPADK
jgi:preprotein translocase subunit SecG